MWAAVQKIIGIASQGLLFQSMPHVNMFSVTLFYYFLLYFYLHYDIVYLWYLSDIIREALKPENLVSLSKRATPVFHPKCSVCYQSKDQSTKQDILISQKTITE